MIRAGFLRYVTMVAIIPWVLFSNEIDIEKLAQDYVIETKRIHIPGYPNAFNAGIVRWRGRLLLSFRNIPNPKSPYTSYLGVVWLNEDFAPVSSPQILCTQIPDSLAPSRAEDARLLAVGDKLFMVYSDNPEEKISKGGFRVYIAQLQQDGELFTVSHVECLRHYPGESRQVREKSWVPFEYQGQLLLAYSLIPHLIFQPLLGLESCVTVATSNQPIGFDWGILRGGTPALQLNDTEYLAFFHSVKPMATQHSENKNILHYFIGAYTFSREPPFEILRASHEPLVATGFYSPPFYKPYWHPIRAVFPCGYVMDENFIWVAYGRQDHECWVIKLDKAKLLASLFQENSQ